MAHVCQGDLFFKEVALMSDPIQYQWRWCRNCYSLFYYGDDNSNGVCPAGDEHDPTGSGNYYLVIDREDKV
jgi:hypothetical protein